MIQARFLHSSIVLGDFIFVTGGKINASEYSGKIECLNLIAKLAWETLLESELYVKRERASVTAISAT